MHINFRPSVEQLEGRALPSNYLSPVPEDPWQLAGEDPACAVLVAENPAPVWPHAVIDFSSLPRDRPYAVIFHLYARDRFWEEVAVTAPQGTAPYAFRRLAVSALRAAGWLAADVERRPALEVADRIFDDGSRIRLAAVDVETLDLSTGLPLPSHMTPVVRTADSVRASSFDPFLPEGGQ